MLALPASASAVPDPRDVVAPAGNNADWFDGSIIQQPGQNCSVLGEPYTEIMINGYGSYGGVDGVVRVGDEYWTSVLIGVPGNPCGSGSSSVATDLKLPKNTAFDPTRQIRCFGTNRFSSDFFEITNQSWNFLGQSGRYCPTGPSAGSASGIGQGYGFRPLANGQMFWMFVPVKSTGTVAGAGECCELGEFNWMSTASAAYANPYRSYTWANIFPAGSGTGSPFIYFTRDPAALPFWDESPDPPWPSDANNKVEFWVNLYTAGEAGYLHYEIRRTDNNNFVAEDAQDAGYNGNVPGSPDLVQVLATGANQGPNGGYVPFYFEQSLGEWNMPAKITWDFAYDGGTSHATGVETFRTLAGPDLDGDGVADSADACDGVKGNLPNGCLTTPTMQGSTAVKRGAKIKRRGQTIGIDCNLLATATANLKMKKGLARSFGLPPRIGGGTASCKPAAASTLRLKLTKKAKRKLARPGKERATLIITFKQGNKTDTVRVPVKIA